VVNIATAVVIIATAVVNIATAVVNIATAVVIIVAAVVIRLIFCLLGQSISQILFSLNHIYILSRHQQIVAWLIFARIEICFTNSVVHGGLFQFRPLSLTLYST
jgi:hypothetical protein